VLAFLDDWTVATLADEGGADQLCEVLVATVRDEDFGVVVLEDPERGRVGVHERSIVSSAREWLVEEYRERLLATRRAHRSMRRIVKALAGTQVARRG
jgi:thymidylate kinase